jgi:apolipoprotein N-acyltransferase
MLNKFQFQNYKHILIPIIINVLLIFFNKYHALIPLINTALLMVFFTEILSIKNAHSLALSVLLLRLPYLIFSLIVLFSSSSISFFHSCLLCFFCILLEFFVAFLIFNFYKHFKSVFLCFIVLFFIEITYNSWWIFDKFVIPYSISSIFIDGKMQLLISYFGYSGASLVVFFICWLFGVLFKKRLILYFYTFSFLFSFWIFSDVLKIDSSKTSALKIEVSQPIISNLEREYGYKSSLFSSAIIEDLKKSINHNLTVFPEVTFPEIIDSGNMTGLGKYFSKNDTVLLGGIYAETNSFFNSVFLIKNGTLTKIYDKQTLVPFEEDWLKPGNKNSYFFHNNTKIGLFICMDVVRTDLFEQSYNENAEVFILFVNNLKQDSLSIQLKLAQVRALETRRPIIFASQMGYSQLINPDGTTENILEWGDQTSKIFSISGYNSISVFYQTKIIFNVLVGIMAFILIFNSNKASKTKPLNDKSTVLR